MACQPLNEYKSTKLIQARSESSWLVDNLDFGDVRLMAAVFPETLHDWDYAIQICRDAAYGAV